MPDQISELVGELISMDFVEGAKISALWGSDPDLPEEREEFQFCLGPLQFGDENAGDYLPGTFLLGVRGNENEPWVVARNEVADLTDEEEHFSSLGFDYELQVLPELKVDGRFFERKGNLPHIVWRLNIQNQSIRPLEIGELAFPLALNNFLEGFRRNEEDTQKLVQSRLNVHKFIGGSGSYVFAQRASGAGAGLLIFPGAETSWEFYHHLSSSIRSPYQWEGIPIVYVHSKAAIEREGWPAWANGHSSRILRPGEIATFETCFAVCGTGRADNVSRALVAAGKPAFRLFPAAVAPASVGISLEMAASGPVEFDGGENAQIEVDTDESGGFAFIKPSKPGPFTLDIKTAGQGSSSIHLFFTADIEQLIRKRANYIVQHQVAGSRAIVMADSRDASRALKMPPAYSYGISDALFLAEKNSIFPLESEIKVLNAYIEDFFLKRIQNPADWSVAAETEDSGAPFGFANNASYYQVWNLHLALARIAAKFAGLSRGAREYLRMAYRTATGQFAASGGFSENPSAQAVFGMDALLADLRAADFFEEADELSEELDSACKRMIHSMRAPFGEIVLDTSIYAHLIFAASRVRDPAAFEYILQQCFAARALSPSWWWYGSDKRYWDGMEWDLPRNYGDRGETCLEPSCSLNSAAFFSLFDNDYNNLPEAYLRLAFGGMLGPWALVGEDGSGAMCYCPDVVSKHFGRNVFSGDSGLALFAYLRFASAMILPERNGMLHTFGCTYELVNGAHRVVPWDGIGKRIILRQYNASFELDFGKIEMLRLDVAKKWFELRVSNPAATSAGSMLTIRGLWGVHLRCGDEMFEAIEGSYSIPLKLTGSETTLIRGEICE